MTFAVAVSDNDTKSSRQALDLHLNRSRLRRARSHRDSFCCGGGGDRVWMEEIGDTHSRPSQSRVREAASLDGVQYLVVACPKDYVMFTDALKTTGLEGRLYVKDIVELVEEAVTA